MKKIYTVLLGLFTTMLFAQVPNGFAYQAVAFNSSGNPVVNGPVSLKISILDNSATGTNLYTETHSKTTNSKGLINLNIGQGTAVSGVFSGINWTTNAKFVKVEMDAAGGSNYTNVGTNQLMSVPYAYVAKKIDLSSSDSSLGNDLIENKSVNYSFTDKYDRKVYAFNSKTGTWVPQIYNVNYANNNYAVPEVTSTNGNFIFIDKYDRKVYVFNARTGAWASQVYHVNYLNNNFSTPTLVPLSNGNLMFADKYDHKMYVFNYVSGNWSSQVFNGNYNSNGSTPVAVTSGSNVAFADKYDHKVSVFNAKTMTWASQVFNINYYNNNMIVPDVTGSNGNFIFIDKYDRKVYVFNSKTGTWSNQIYNVNYLNNNFSVPVTSSSETN
ncbi:hypothetical protein [Chryseobacterium sp. T16E-39]|uniref:hypothetical protein n=1 Tax=Chryseobacterium sp. T16E-39 TaxID=2015076 RepID=UPI0012F77D8B|nr:hypothetical protein [Chryseobacterium sp. T16E-39]